MTTGVGTFHMTGSTYSPKLLMRVQELDRIESNSDVLSGQPVIKGTRVPVYVLVEAIAEGDSVEDLRDAYPFLEAADIRQALRFAARMSQVEYAEA